MRKRIITLGLAAIMSLSMAVCAFAGWEQSGDDWKYKEGDKYISKQWLQLGDLWYRFDSNSRMEKGWVKVSGKWYFMDKNNGEMRTGWLQNDDGKWYFLTDSGEMLTDAKTPDGFYVNKGGIYNPDEKQNQSAGPVLSIETKVQVLGINGVQLPSMTGFGTANLADDNWGIEGSAQAMTAIGDTMKASNGDVNPITVTGKTIQYKLSSSATPVMQLAKTKDQYELTIYSGLRGTDSENVLLAMSSMISSTPSTIKEKIFTAMTYNRTVLKMDEYTTCGDSKIQYDMDDDGVVVFKIKAK